MLSTEHCKYSECVCNERAVCVGVGVGASVGTLSVLRGCVYVARVHVSVVFVHHGGVSTNPESPGRAQRLLLDGVVESKGQGFGAWMILN